MAGRRKGRVQQPHQAEAPGAQRDASSEEIPASLACTGYTMVSGVPHSALSVHFRGTNGASGSITIKNLSNLSSKLDLSTSPDRAPLYLPMCSFCGDALDVPLPPRPPEDCISVVVADSRSPLHAASLSRAALIALAYPDYPLTFDAPHAFRTPSPSPLLPFHPPLQGELGSTATPKRPSSPLHPHEGDTPEWVVVIAYICTTSSPSSPTSSVTPNLVGVALLTRHNPSPLVPFSVSRLCVLEDLIANLCGDASVSPREGGRCDTAIRVAARLCDAVVNYFGEGATGQVSVGGLRSGVGGVCDTSPFPALHLRSGGSDELLATSWRWGVDVHSSSSSPAGGGGGGSSRLGFDGNEADADQRMTEGKGGPVRAVVGVTCSLRGPAPLPAPTRVLSYIARKAALPLDAALIAQCVRRGLFCVRTRVGAAVSLSGPVVPASGMCVPADVVRSTDAVSNAAYVSFGACLGIRCAKQLVGTKHRPGGSGGGECRVSDPQRVVAGGDGAVNLRTQVVECLWARKGERGGGGGGGGGGGRGGARSASAESKLSDYTETPTLQWGGDVWSLVGIQTEVLGEGKDHPVPLFAELQKGEGNCAESFASGSFVSFDARGVCAVMVALRCDVQTAVRAFHLMLVLHMWKMAQYAERLEGAAAARGGLSSGAAGGGGAVGGAVSGGRPTASASTLTADVDALETADAVAATLALGEVRAWAAEAELLIGRFVASLLVNEVTQMPCEERYAAVRRLSCSFVEHAMRAVHASGVLEAVE